MDDCIDFYDWIPCHLKNELEHHEKALEALVLDRDKIRDLAFESLQLDDWAEKEPAPGERVRLRRRAELLRQACHEWAERMQYERAALAWVKKEIELRGGVD